MAITYSELLVKIPKWLMHEGDPEFEAMVPDFIRLGELRIAREADLRLFKEHAFSTFNRGDPFVKTPTDCLITREIRISGGAYLINQPETFIREFWPDHGKLGIPKYYAQFNQVSIVVAPTPIEASQIELTYTIQPPGLSPANPSTWISRFAEDLLLYASLIEAAAYKQGLVPEQMALYERQYSAALSRLMNQELQNRSDQYLQRGTI